MDARTHCAEMVAELKQSIPEGLKMRVGAKCCRPMLEESVEKMCCREVMEQLYKCVG